MKAHLPKLNGADNHHFHPIKENLAFALVPLLAAAYVRAATIYGTIFSYMKKKCFEKIF